MTSQQNHRRPVARIAASLDDGGIRLDGGTSEGAVAYRWAAREGNPESLTFTGGSGPTVSLAAPTTPGEYYVGLEVTAADGATDASTTYVVASEDGVRIPDYDHEPPAWVESAIVYGIIPPLFGDPPLQAVTRRLPYLRELGVDAIWLSPITVRPPGDYGYAVVDYFTVNPEYGSDDDLRELVRAAHGNDIRVLLDFVPNHSSDQHPFFRDAVERGPESPYYDWYDRDEQGAHTHYFDWANLPNFNFENPDVREYVTDAFTYWVREFDIDGYRVDACWGVQYRRPDFWAPWRRELKRIKPDLLLLAEAGARDVYWFENGYDVAYDWTGDLGRWAWEHAFDEPGQIAARLSAAIAADPHPDRVFRFLNNNDTGARFHTTHGVDLTRVAAALVLTLPGTPCVYTGEEIGAEYSPYPIPPALDWSADPAGLHPWYEALCHLRRSQPSLHSRHFTEVLAEGDLYAFLRHGPQGEEPLLVALNFGTEAAALPLALPPGFASFASDGRLHDMLNTTDVDVRSLTLPLPGSTAWVLAPAAGGTA